MSATPAATAASTTSPDNRFNFVQIIGDAMAGIYALYVVTALRGHHLLWAGWFGGFVLMVMLAVFSNWNRFRSIGGVIRREFSLLIPGVLLVALIPGWSSGWVERACAVLVARGLVWLLRLACQLSTAPNGIDGAERLRVVLVATVIGLTMLPWVTPDLIGPKDARWYGNMITDFITQFRSGKFPVFAGETVYAFNGAVHPYRTAPWHFYFAAALDVITGRSLAPLALQHLTAILSYGAAVGGCYVGLRRLRSDMRWTAWLMAITLGTSPALLMPLVMHDMYMTVMAMPVLVVLYIALVLAVEAPSVRAFGLVGGSCAALWFCHPPIAMLGLAVAAFCLACHLAFRGVKLSYLLQAACGGIAFIFLVAPYFYATSELGDHSGHVLQDLVWPAVGFCMVVYGSAAGGRGNVMAFGVLAAGVGLLWWVRPSLLVITAETAVSIAFVFGLRRCWPRRGFQRLFAPAGVILLLSGLELTVRIWPQQSLGPSLGAVRDLVPTFAQATRAYFWPISLGGADQPGALCWLLLVASVGLVWKSRSDFARVGWLAVVALALAVFPVGQLTLALWSHTPSEVYDVIGVAYALRLLPVLVPLLVVVMFIFLADLEVSMPSVARVIQFAVVLALPWSLWEHAQGIRRAAGFRLGPERTAQLMRPENIMLQRYSWDLLQIPRFFSNGVMDPRLENRFWRTDDPTKPLIDPDEIARRMERLNGVQVAVDATQNALAPTWLDFDRTIELKVGEQKLLRIDFLGATPHGWLIFNGRHSYRDYILPQSGFSLGFGAAPQNSHTVLLANNGDLPDSIKISLTREGPGATTVPSVGPYAHFGISAYVAEQAPIEVKSMSPLLLKVDASEDGWLETVRSYAPGYRVSVDGQPATGFRSKDGLLAVRLKKGIHEVFVRFRGTPALRAWTWCGFGLWAMAVIYLVWRVLAVARLDRSRERLPASS